MPNSVSLLTSIFISAFAATSLATAQKTDGFFPSSGKMLLACGDDEGLRENGLRKLSQHVYTNDAQSESECDSPAAKEGVQSEACYGVCVPLISLSAAAQAAALRVYDENHQRVSLPDAELVALGRRFASELHARGFVVLDVSSRTSLTKAVK